MINFQANQQEIKYIPMQIVHIDHTVWNSVLLSRTPNNIIYSYHQISRILPAAPVVPESNKKLTLSRLVARKAPPEPYMQKISKRKKGQRKLVFLANDAQNGMYVWVENRKNTPNAAGLSEQFFSVVKIGQKYAEHCTKP